MTDLRSGWVSGVFGYWRPNGTFMPIIVGAAPDGDGDGDEDGDGDGSDDEADEEEEGDEEDGDEEIKDPKAKLEAEAAKNRRLTRKLRKAEKEKQAAQKAIKDAEDAKKTDEQKLADRATAAETEVEKLKEEMKRGSVRELVLDHDEVDKLTRGQRKAILRIFPFDKVDIDDEGDNNIDELIDVLKEDLPSMFRTDEGDDEEDEEEEKRPKRTASPPKKRKNKDAVDRAALEKRLPHLARHRAS